MHPRSISHSVRLTRILAAASILSIGIFACTQTPPPPRVSDLPADSLVKRVEPLYPPIAKAAHITGQLSLEFTITLTGDIADIKVLSGPAMLQQASIDAVKQWKYHPILINGQPTAVRTVAILNFGFNPKSADDLKEQEVNIKVSPYMIKCVDLLNHNDPASLDACRQEVELEAQYTVGRRQMDRLSSHDEYGLALLGFAHQPKEALAQFELEIGLLPGVLTKTDAEFAWAYWHRGIALMYLGDFTRAEQDFSTAEESASLAIVHLPEMAENYRKTRAKIVTMHVQLLEQEGKHDEAQKLRTKQNP
jgi:TonB family protein